MSKVKKNKAVPRIHHAWAKVERKYSSYSFLNSALDGVSGQRYAPANLNPREMIPGTHWIGGWVGLRGGLETETKGKILCLCRGSKQGRPVCSQTQY
jgi:hypothetical protein